MIARKSYSDAENIGETQQGTGIAPIQQWAFAGRYFWSVGPLPFDTFCGVWGSHGIYPGPGHRPANAASLSMPESGTNYRQLSDCQNCGYLHSSASSRPTSSTRVLVVVACVSYIPPSGAVYKCPDSTQFNSTSSFYLPVNRPVYRYGTSAGKSNSPNSLTPACLHRRCWHE